MGLALPKQEPLVFAKPKGDERQRIIRMRTALVMGSPFYGLLAMRLKLVENYSAKTAATDAKNLYYNPEYIAGMSNAKLKGLIGHETLHCTNGHMWRRGSREHRLWNLACDWAIDSVLQNSGFDVPNALVNPAWKGWSAEQIYAVLLEEVEEQRQQKQQQKGQGQAVANNSGGEGGTGKGKPSAQKPEQPGQEGADGEPGDPEGAGEGCGSSYQQTLDEIFGPGPTKGEVLDAPAETAIQDQADWAQAVVSAAQVAKQKGNLPADLEILIEEMLEPRVDWKALLSRFAQQCAKMDYNWSMPSPRYTSRGIYLPRLRSEQVGPMVFGWDTSGSHYDKHTQEATAAEVTEVMRAVNPEILYVAHCDAKLQGWIELEPGDNPKWKPKGGGGTNFTPVFSKVAEEGIEPACLIFLTDCMGEYPEEEPPYPVLWLTTIKPEKLHSRYIPPFGELVYLDLT